MGGRGTYGGGIEKTVVFKIPELSGSEKQISWAKDILSYPYNGLKNFALGEQQNIDYNINKEQSKNKKAAYEEAAKKYSSELDRISKLQNVFQASRVISGRNNFASFANGAVEKAFKKRGIPLYEMRKL